MRTTTLKPKEFFKLIKLDQWELVGTRQLEHDTQTARISYRCKSEPSNIYIVDRMQFYDTQKQRTTFKEVHQLINGYKSTRYITERVDR